MLKKRLASGLLVASMLVGVVAVAGVTAQGAPVTQEAAVAAAADVPPPAVEDFTYPETQAAAAKADRGIDLISGDGNIVFTQCSDDYDAGRIMVESYDSDQKFCFHVRGAGGFLKVSLPRVYSIRTYEYTAKVGMTVDGTDVSFDAPKNKWTGIGTPVDPEHRDHTLVQITASK
ncbi:hypothetical protein [Streptomyces sp. NPDC003395]